jgi:hypothetical protein
MLVAVRRMLLTGREDAALVLNGNWLLLNRVDGVLVKHRRDTWWQTYAAANDCSGIGVGRYRRAPPSAAAG